MESKVLYRFTKTEYFIEMLKDIRYEKSSKHKDKSLDDFYLPLRLYPFKYMSDPTDGQWGIYPIIIGLHQYAEKNNVEDKMHEFLSSYNKLQWKDDFCYMSSWSTKSDKYMWENFAQNCHGVRFCICYNRMEDIVKKQNCQINPCAYVSAENYYAKYKAQIESLHNVADGEPRSYFISILEFCKWAKHTNYSKEAEVRIIKNTDADAVPLIDDKDNKYLEILIPLTAMSVTFGCRADFDEKLKEIKDILKDKMGEKLCDEYVYRGNLDTMKS